MADEFDSVPVNSEPTKKERFIDFEEESEETEEGGIIRVPLPKGMYVRCVDGKQRIGRVSGSNKRKLYIKQGDLVIIKPWEYEETTKCDVIYKYRRGQVDWLRNRGYLKKLEEEF